MVEEHYIPGVKATRRRWDSKDKDWVLREFPWQTNRVLIITEYDKYYSAMLFGTMLTMSSWVIMSIFSFHSKEAIAVQTAWIWTWTSTSNLTCVFAGRMRMTIKRQLNRA